MVLRYPYGPMPVVIIRDPAWPFPLDLSDHQHRRVLSLHEDPIGREIGALRAASEQLGEFLLLKDSVRILDADEFWRAIDELEGPRALFAWPSAYLGVYSSPQLAPLLQRIPEFLSKEDSIRWEVDLLRELRLPAIWDEVRDDRAKRFEVLGEGLSRHLELVIGNDIIEKYKGTARCGRRACSGHAGICPHSAPHLSEQRAALTGEFELDDFGLPVYRRSPFNRLF